MALLVIGAPFAFWLTPSPAERLALIGSLLIVLIVELLNTAIEKLADRITMDTEPTIKRVKDIASAAVGLSILMAGAVWAVVAWTRLGF